MLAGSVHNTHRQAGIGAAGSGSGPGREVQCCAAGEPITAGYWLLVVVTKGSSVQ